MNFVSSVMTPKMVADRWMCSEQQVRKLIASGQLPHFKAGGKLIRLLKTEVEAYEWRTNGGSPASRENSASSGEPIRTVVDIVLEPATPKKQPRRQRLDTRNLRARQAQP